MLQFISDKNFTNFRMLRPEKLGPTIWSSIIMAVAGMGDAMLYVYLPLSGDQLGMSFFTIGFLLSINKFIRLFTNRWIAFLTQDLGVKNILLLGMIVAGVTTITYGINPLIWVWIISRMFWGFSYSALRFSTIQYGGFSKNTGSAIGLSRGIQEIGPILAYWIGPIMISSIGPEFTFLSWAIVLIILLPAMIYMPEIKPSVQKIKPYFSFQKPEMINFWIFFTSFSVEGLLIVGLSKIIDFNSDDPGRIMLLTAIYISMRRVFNVIISPLSGWLSDKFSFSKLFHFSCMLIISGIAIITYGLPKIGITLAFLGSAINLTLLPLIALNYTPITKNFDVLTKMSTSRDIGSAFGSLLALNLFDWLGIHIPLIVLGMILLFIWFNIPKFKYNYEFDYENTTRFR